MSSPPEESFLSTDSVHIISQYQSRIPDSRAYSLEAFESQSQSLPAFAFSIQSLCILRFFPVSTRSPTNLHESIEPLVGPFDSRLFKYAECIFQLKTHAYAYSVEAFSPFRLLKVVRVSDSEYSSLMFQFVIFFHISCYLYSFYIT